MPSVPTPTGAGAKVTPARKSPAPQRSIAAYLVLVGVSSVLFVTWVYMHHTVTTEHVSEHEVLKNSRAMATDQQLSQVQRLYDETRTLLRSVLSQRDNASSSAFAAIERSLDHLSGGSAVIDAAVVSPARQETDIFSLKQQVAALQKSLVDEKQRREQLEAQSAEFGARSGAAATPTAMEPRWLVIGIPTVPRASDEDYLLHTLESLSRQLPRDPSDLMFIRVAVLVVNVHDVGKPHRRFEEAKALYAAGAHPMSGYFYFTDLPVKDHAADPKPGATAENDQGNANIPGFRVRKQTRNVASVLRQAYARFPEGVGRYYLFLEDDMLLCRHGFTAIQYMLQKVSRYHPNWLAIRASYGMNGIFLNMRDVPVFASYLVRNQLRRPPDHLVVEWFAGETPEAKHHKGARANVGFRHNIFDHIGKLSSLRKEAQTSFPRCYELLAEPTVFKVEAFDPLQCPRDDVWPCRNIMGGVPDKVRLNLEGLGPESEVF